MLGTVVGIDATTAKVKQIDPAATDGTEVAVGVLATSIDASLIDREDGFDCQSRRRRRSRPDLACRHHPWTNRRHRPTQGLACSFATLFKGVFMQNPFSNPGFLDGQPRPHQPSAQPLRPAESSTCSRSSRCVSARSSSRRRTACSISTDCFAGGPRHRDQRDKRKMRSFVVPFIPHDDVVLPDRSPGAARLRFESELEPWLASWPAIWNHAQQARHHAGTPAHGCLTRHHPDADGSTSSTTFTTSSASLPRRSTSRWPRIAPTSARNASIPWRTSRRTCAASYDRRALPVLARVLRN